MYTFARHTFVRMAACVLACLAGVAIGRAHADDAAAGLWSVDPVVAVAAPVVKNEAWPAAGRSGEIDRFVLARLESALLSPAPPADKLRLLRRAFADLHGLPPTPDETAEFLADDRPDAYARLVDRLLDSPRYGERWGRYWLDVVRYADTNGYERDAEKKNAWRYRDWVIQAFNDDLPYDRFIAQQLAGDELPGASDATRVATGFLRVGTFDDEPNDPLQYKFEQLDDLIHATSTAFLALTLKCARCHDHKYDPIPQHDYYGMLNFFSAGKPADGELLALVDAGREPPPVRLLKGGDPRAEQDVVPVGYLSMIPQWNPSVTPPEEGAVSSGRRLQLARWIADRRNPLTARVLVNRLWQQHFGAGLVRTSDNFGNTGAEPTHPELLDWLAAELMENGWRIKPLHRLLMLSSVYRQDSVHPREAQQAVHDPQNELCWKSPRRRLDAESLRDAMLLVSGDLNLTMGGPGFYPTVDSDALEGLSMKDKAWKQSPPNQQRRRSVYMFAKRSLQLPLLTTFDLADTTQPCSQRTVSTVAPQALALLNNSFVHERSARLAERVTAEAGTNLADQITRAWQLTLCRQPSPQELVAAATHLERQRQRSAAGNTAIGAQDAANGDNAAVDGTGTIADNGAATAEQRALQSLCHVLLNTNEFIYVD